MKRIKWFAIVTAMLCMILVAGTAPAEDAGTPIGFGFVNADAVALRKEPGGERITRLPQDTLVWVKDSETDSRGNCGTGSIQRCMRTMHIRNTAAG